MTDDWRPDDDLWNDVPEATAAEPAAPEPDEPEAPEPEAPELDEPEAPEPEVPPLAPPPPPDADVAFDPAPTEVYEPASLDEELPPSSALPLAPPPPPFAADEGLSAPSSRVGTALIALGVLILVALLVLLYATGRDEDRATLAPAETSTTEALVTATTVLEETTLTTETPTTAAATPTTRSPSSTTARVPSTTRPTSRPATTATTARSTTTSAVVAERSASRSNGFEALQVAYYRNPDGNFDGQVRIRNNASTTRGGQFSVRLYKNDQLVGTLQGSSSGIGPGETVEVDMTSNDPFVGEIDRYEFTATPTS